MDVHPDYETGITFRNSAGKLRIEGLGERRLGVTAKVVFELIEEHRDGSLASSRNWRSITLSHSPRAQT